MERLTEGEQQALDSDKENIDLLKKNKWVEQCNNCKAFDVPPDNQKDWCWLKQFQPRNKCDKLIPKYNLAEAIELAKLFNTRFRDDDEY